MCGGVTETIVQGYQGDGGLELVCYESLWPLPERQLHLPPHSFASCSGSERSQGCVCVASPLLLCPPKNVNQVKSATNCVTVPK